MYQTRLDIHPHSHPHPWSAGRGKSRISLFFFQPLFFGVPSARLSRAKALKLSTKNKSQRARKASSCSTKYYNYIFFLMFSFHAANKILRLLYVLFYFFICSTAWLSSSSIQFRVQKPLNPKLNVYIYYK